MNFNSDTTPLKVLSYKCIFDKPSKMSGRVAAAILFAVIRSGEIIDWWFPVKANKRVNHNE
jgi:hypothetical protein